MEVARLLSPRRVEVEFRPDRMAEELLARAFDRLTRALMPDKVDRDSVQGRSEHEIDEVSLIQEVAQ